MIRWRHLFRGHKGELAGNRTIPTQSLNIPLSQFSTLCQQRNSQTQSIILAKLLLYKNTKLPMPHPDHPHGKSPSPRTTVTGASTRPSSRTEVPGKTCIA